MKTTNIICADCDNVVVVPNWALPVSKAYCSQCADRHCYVTYDEMIEDHHNSLVAAYGS